MPTFFFPRKPNAGRQPLPEAGATQERTLEAVGWTPWFGWERHPPLDSDTTIVCP